MKKILYTMIRVGNLKRSIDFYSKILGMKLMSTYDDPVNKFTLAFMGIENSEESSQIELTYNYGVNQYDIGDGYGHVAFEVEDCDRACVEIKAKGGKIISEAHLMKGLNEIIAFIQDPDGYKIELVQLPATRG